MAVPKPDIGNWYRRTSGGELFEVVAVDEDDGTIELQSYDGTVEEMDVEDWNAQWEDGALEPGEAPEDWTGSVDIEPEDDAPRSADGYEGEGALRASGLDTIDLFE